MSRRTLKIPKKDSKRIEKSKEEEYDSIISSLDSIQKKTHKMSPEKPSSVSKVKITLIIGFILIGTIGFLSLGYYPQTQINSTNNTISEDINFKFQTLDGNEVMLSDFEGSPIIIDFMATYCAPCKTQIKELISLKANFPNVQIISISTSSDDSISVLKNYKADNGITWTIGRDITKKGAEIFKVQYIPTIAFINSAGNLRHLESGVTYYDTLVDWVNE